MPCMKIESILFLFQVWFCTGVVLKQVELDETVIMVLLEM